MRLCPTRPFSAYLVVGSRKAGCWQGADGGQMFAPDPVPCLASGAQSVGPFRRSGVCCREVGEIAEQLRTS